MDFLNKLKRPTVGIMNSKLPNKIYMRRIVTRSMHRNFMSPTRVIQRSWRRYQKLRGLTDPITLNSLQSPVIVFVTPEGCEYYFSAVPLAMYIKESGDYRNPMNRIEFNPIEIRRLVHLSGIIDILNVRECKEKRADRLQRESLRTFFEEEIISSIDTFLQYIRSNEHYVNTGHLVRHMLALVFPTIIVTVVRVVRTDPDFIEELFQLIMSRRDHLSDIVQTRPNAIGISTMYTQFINDIRQQVDNNTLSTGHTANVEIGGMRVNIDLRDI
jgi:hypothetical protein